MKQVTIMAAVLALAIAALVYNAPQQDNVFRVGVSLPLTGDVAEFGEAVRNGIQLAKADAPESFSDLRFYYQDNRYHAATAVRAYASLKNVHNVDMIFDWGEVTLGAIAPLAEKDKTPVIGMSYDPVPSVDKKYIIRSINHSAQFAAVTFRYLREQGFKKIAIIKTEDPFPNSMVEGMQQQLQPGETLEVVFAAQPTEMDFKSAIVRIKQAKPDVIGVYLLPGQAGAFYRQAGAMGLELPSFGTDVFESKTEIAQANGHMDGAVFPILYVPEEFSVRYEETFGNNLHMTFAYNAYFVAKLIASASMKVADREWSPSELLEAVHRSAEKFDAYKIEQAPEAGSYMEFPIVMRRVVGESIEPLAP